MADSKLSALTSAGAFADADLLYIVQGGTSYKTTWGAVKAAILLAKYPEVANFAALPAAGDHDTETYVCLASQGTYFINRKPAGFYYSDGATWAHVGDLPEDYFTDSILQISDDADPTKICKFQLSSITAGNTRTLTVPDASGTIALTSDLPAAAIPASYLDVDGTLAANSDVKVASQKATKTYADTKTTAAAALAAATAIKLDDFGTPDDNTDLNASTSRHGLLLKATAPASGLVSYVGIGNGETVYSNKALLDTTNPANLGSVGPGTATVAARRDHVHAMPSAADVSALPTAGGTMSGSITLGENTGVALDPAGSADGKWSGITVTGVSGYSQAFGDVVTLDKDDSRWEAVDISVAAAATGDARGIMGMVVVAGTDGNACTILLHGIIRADANFPTLTIGAPVYASTTGDVVVTQPTTTDYVIRVIGHGLTADELYFHPDNAYITHT